MCSWCEVPENQDRPGAYDRELWEFLNPPSGNRGVPPGTGGFPPGTGNLFSYYPKTARRYALPVWADFFS